MIDLRYNDKNNQKKVGSVFASGSIAHVPTDTASLFTLPPDVLVTRVSAIVTTVSSVAGSSIKVKCGSIEIGQLAVDTEGIVADTDPSYFSLGGLVTIESGSTAPAGAVFRIIIEYIELSLTDGTYTD